MTQTRSLLRHADFLKLWTAETISQFGTQVSLLAIPLVAVTILEATAFEVAMLGTIEFLPFILFSLPAGAWVDRLRDLEDHSLVEGRDRRHPVGPRCPMCACPCAGDGQFRACGRSSASQATNRAA